MSIKSSIRKIKKRFVAGFGLMLLSERLLTGLIALASKFLGDESGATAQNATMPVNRPRRLTRIGVQRGPHPYRHFQVVDE